VVEYNNVTGSVKKVTDENGGVWQLTEPTVGGSYQVHSAAVLGAGPSDYWRLADNHVVQAVNEVTNQVNGGQALYSGVTIGVAGGPFDGLGPSDDTTVASFNGTSSYLLLPSADVPKTGPTSIAMWFKLAPGQSGVLLGYQTSPLPTQSTAGWVPALYVGGDGKLRASCGTVAATRSPVPCRSTTTPGTTWCWRRRPRHRTSTSMARRSTLGPATSSTSGRSTPRSVAVSG
jgi:hypothetical protein